MERLRLVFSETLAISEIRGLDACGLFVGFMVMVFHN